MFFSSVKEIKWLLKEINRFLSQRMSNIYLKGTIEKKWRSLKFGFCKFKKFVSESIFGELQLTQTSLNFENFLLELKNQRSGSKTVSLMLFFFWKELWRFTVKEFMLFIEQKYKLNKNETESKMENPRDTFREMSLVCFSSWKNFELKVKLWWAAFFVMFILSGGNFFNITVMNILSEYIYFYISKTSLYKLFMIVESL